MKAQRNINFIRRAYLLLLFFILCIDSASSQASLFNQTPIFDSINVTKTQDYFKYRSDPLINYSKLYQEVLPFIETTEEEFEEEGDNELNRRIAWDHYFWRFRLGTDENYPGNTLEYGELMKDNLPDYTCESDLADWSEVGPINVKNTANQNIMAKGRIVSVWVDTENNTNILVGTETAGIYRSTDGGDTWINVTDNLNIYGVGITDIKSCPGSNSYIIAGTGGRTGLTAGVLISTDGGGSWSIMGDYLGNITNPISHVSFDYSVTTTNCSDHPFFISTQNSIYKYTPGTGWEDITPPSIIQRLSDGEFTESLMDFTITNTGNIILTSNQKWGNEGNVYIYGNNDPGEYNPLDWVEVRDDSDFSSNITNSILIIGGRVSEERNGKILITISTAAGLSDDYYGVNHLFYETTDDGDSFVLIGSGSSGNISNSQIYKNEHEYSLETNGPIFYGDCSLHKLHISNGTVQSSATYFSTGCSISDQDKHADIRALVSYLDNSGHEQVLLANDGGLARYDSDLNHSYNLNGQGLNILQFYGFGMSQGTNPRILAGAQDNGSLLDLESQGGDFSHFFGGDGGGSWVSMEGSYGLFGDNNVIHKINIDSGQQNTLPTNQAYHSWFLQYPLEVRESNQEIYYNRDSQSNTFERVIADFESFTETLLPIQSTPLVGSLTLIGISQNEDTVYISSDAGSGKYIDSDPNNGLNLNKFLRTDDDGLTYTDLTLSPVYKENGSEQSYEIAQQLWWRSIASIAVNPLNAKELFIGLAGVNAAFTEGDPYYRVLYSNDAGTTWTDYSIGLPPLPITALASYDGTKGLLFAGTDLGIYYRTATMDHWECYTQGLPRVDITEMHINYCTNELYASTYGRGIWKSPINIALPELHVTTDQIWNAQVKLGNDVVVEPGATLTVKGEILFAEQKRIKVKPGGTLIVDGGIIHSLCGSFWQGIEAWGNTDENQYQDGSTYHQARVILKNGATIENARNGITNWHPVFWNERGGIIQATDANFINNRRSVAFMAYSNWHGSPSNRRADASYFKRCHFTWDDDYLINMDDDTQEGMVTLWGVYGVGFYGCTFIDSANVDYPKSRDMAIHSIDASYQVGAYCSTIHIAGEPCPLPYRTPSLFKGFNRAIDASGGVDNAALNLQYSDFSGNNEGVYLNTAEYSLVLRNTFEMGNFIFAPSQNKYSYNLGLYSWGTSQYTFEENSFQLSEDASSYGNGLAIYGPNEDEYNMIGVYKNDFSGLNQASTAGEHNRGDSDIGGLKFICNNNDVNENDFTIQDMDGDVTTSPKIGTFQGSLSKPAGNTFSLPDADPQNFVHWDAETYSSHKYYFNQNIPDQVPATAEIYSPNNTFYTSGISINNTCPTHFDGGISHEHTGKIAGLVSGMVTNKADYYGLKYTYSQIIDGGDTQGELNEIALSWPEDAWDLHDQLIARSPNNSEAVLIAAAEKNIMPQSMLLEVLLANPDALRSGSVIKYMQYDLINPLPQYMIDMLYNAQDQSTLRTEMLLSLNDKFAEYTRYNRELSLYYLADSAYYNLDSAMYYMQDLKTPRGKYALAAAYASKGNYTSAVTEIDSIPYIKKLSEAQTDQYDAMKEFYSFLGTVHDDDRNIAQLEASEIQELQTMADNPTGGSAALRAQNILCFFYKICSDKTGNPKSMQITKKPAKNPEMGENKLEVYPNPAGDYLTIHYNVLFAKPQTFIEIYGSTGVLVTRFECGRMKEGIKVWDTRNVIGGVYLVGFTQDGKTMETKKVVIQH